MRISIVPATFAAMLVLLAAACEKTPAAATETERAICEAWQDSLPTRSHSDTEQTQDEIDGHYNVFLAVCGPLGFDLPF